MLRTCWFGWRNVPAKWHTRVHMMYYLCKGLNESLAVPIKKKKKEQHHKNHWSLNGVIIENTTHLLKCHLNHFEIWVNCQTLPTFKKNIFNLLYKYKQTSFNTIWKFYCSSFSMLNFYLLFRAYNWNNLICFLLHF